MQRCSSASLPNTGLNAGPSTLHSGAADSTPHRIAWCTASSGAASSSVSKKTMSSDERLPRAGRTRCESCFTHGSARSSARHGTQARCGAPACQVCVVCLRVGVQRHEELGVVRQVAVAPLPQRCQLLPRVAECRLKVHGHVAQLCTRRGALRARPCTGRRARPARRTHVVQLLVRLVDEASQRVERAALRTAAIAASQREAVGARTRTLRAQELSSPPGGAAAGCVRLARRSRARCACSSARGTGTRPGACASRARTPRWWGTRCWCTAGCGGPARHAALRWRAAQ